MVILHRKDKPNGEKRQPIRRTLKDAIRKLNGYLNKIDGLYIEVEGYEIIKDKDGNFDLKKKAEKKEK